MAGKRNLSYFAEEARRNNNPNFFVNMRDEDLRRQVKRIVRDMRNSNIEEQDFVYFKNDKIICVNRYKFDGQQTAIKPLNVN